MFQGDLFKIGSTVYSTLIIKENFEVGWCCLLVNTHIITQYCIASVQRAQLSWDNFAGVLLINLKCCLNLVLEVSKYTLYTMYVKTVVKYYSSNVF